VLIHGFRTKFEDAQGQYTTACEVLESCLGTRNYVGFYWPSDLGIDFAKGVSNANKAGQYLIHVLSSVTRWYGNNQGRVHLMGHSLGGRVILSTLKENDARYVHWGDCFALASAVHSNVYFTSFANTNLVPRKTWVYHSQGDWILKYLYALYYWLFDRNLQGIPGYQEWGKLSVEEKIEYLHQLDMKVLSGEKPDNEMDKILYEAIERAEKDAMGLVGAMLGNPVSITKVQNVDVTGVVSGHTYWSNAEVMKRVSKALQSN
jgi:hypothetical protein